MPTTHYNTKTMSSGNHNNHNNSEAVSTYDNDYYPSPLPLCRHNNHHNYHESL